MFTMEQWIQFLTDHGVDNPGEIEWVKVTSDGMIIRRLTRWGEYNRHMSVGRVAAYVEEAIPFPDKIVDYDAGKKMMLDSEAKRFTDQVRSEE